MSDPTKPNLSATISAAAGVKLADLNVPAHKIPGKIASALTWGIPAAFCLLLCVGFVVLAALQQYHGGSPSVVLLAIELGVPGVVAVYCVYKADSEGLKALLSTLKNIRALIKGDANG